MMVPRSLLAAMVAAAIVLAGAGFSTGQDTAVLSIEKALDGPAQIAFKDLTLQELRPRLEAAIGVGFELDTPAVRQLPYGELTTLNVQISGMAWREALAELLKPMALRYQTGADRIYILGTKDLLNQPQRLNQAELDALVKLQASHLDDSEKQLLKQLQQVTRLKFGLVVNGQRLEKADKDLADDILTDVPEPASRILDLYSRRALGPGGSWYLRVRPTNGWGPLIDIVLAPKVELVRMKLKQRIDVEFKGQPIDTILQDLAQRANVALQFEPGCIGLLDEDLRQNSSLVMRSGTTSSALEALAGMTGLEYTVDSDGVRISASETLKQMAVARAASTTAKRSALACILTTKVPQSDAETMLFIREDALQAEGLLDKFQQVRQEGMARFMQYLRDYQPAEPSGSK